MKRIPIMLLAILASIGTSLAQGPQSWYTLATSRTGDTVRLNDLEPHSWSYYTAASPIHSLNPVDVRIAYYGNGQCYSSTSATPSGALTAVSGVKVGVNENKRRYCTGFHLLGCCICRGFWRPSIHHHRRHHPRLDCRWLQRDKTDGGEMYGSTHIYFGGDAQCNSNNNNTAINSSLGGNIFGAGSGIEGGTTVGQVYHSEVVIADNCMVERDVYGGGNYGYVNAGTGHGSDIYIMGGTVNGKVFGGSNQQQGQQVEIRMTGGTVIGGVYGGSNSSGAVSGPVKVNILGGTVGEDGQDDNHGNVFGSGFGVGTSVTGDVYVIIGDSTALTTGHTTQPFIWGHVFGGGHEANYDATGHEFKVLGNNGTVNKNIFGGGKGVLNEVKGQIIGNTYVQLRGHIHINGDVFGGGMDGEVRGNSFVIIKD